MTVQINQPAKGSHGGPAERGGLLDPARFDRAAVNSG
jgi:hypothetical protein